MDAFDLDNYYNNDTYFLNASPAIFFLYQDLINSRQHRDLIHCNAIYSDTTMSLRLTMLSAFLACA